MTRKLKGVKKHRKVGHKTKHNKKSVEQRRKDRLLNQYFHKQQKQQ